MYGSYDMYNMYALRKEVKKLRDTMDVIVCSSFSCKNLSQTALSEKPGEAQVGPYAASVRVKVTRDRAPILGVRTAYTECERAARAIWRARVVIGAAIPGTLCLARG